MKFLMPDGKSALPILTPLFGDDTKFSPAPKSEQPGDWVALYVGTDNTPVAACICNKEFVAYGGSALMMIPAGVARQAATDGNVTDVMVESFHEIMNICSRFLMSDHTPHLRLGVVKKRADAPELAELEKAATRKDFQVDIPKYGTGSLACLVT